MFRALSSSASGFFHFNQRLELIEEEVVASIVALLFKQWIMEILIEVRGIRHPVGGRLEMATGLRPSLIVGIVAVGVIVVRVMVHAVDIIRLGVISSTEEHPQAQYAGQKQRHAASEHVSSSMK